MVIGEVTVTFVDAVEPLPPVAVTVTWHVPGTRGAVNNPVLASMAPHEAANVAGMFVMNCCVVPSLTTGATGDKVNWGGATIVSCAVALFAGPLVALPVIVQTEPGVADAVKRPVEVMFPQLADQVTG